MDLRETAGVGAIEDGAGSSRLDRLIWERGVSGPLVHWVQHISLQGLQGLDTWLIAGDDGIQRGSFVVLRRAGSDSWVLTKSKRGGELRESPMFIVVIEIPAGLGSLTEPSEHLSVGDGMGFARW